MHEIYRIDANTIRFERLLDAPVETVWRYLTDGELRARWFAGGAADLREGGEIALAFDHDNLSSEPQLTPERFRDHKGHVALERVVRCDRPNVFAFTFSGPDSGNIATFELSAAGDGRTRLVLTHSGIPDDRRAANFGSGWHAHLAALAEVVRGGQLRNFWAQFETSEATVKAALA